jgi:hypothetical protein
MNFGIYELLICGGALAAVIVIAIVVYLIYRQKRKTD